MQAPWKPIKEVELDSGEMHVDSAHNGLTGTLTGKLFGTIDAEVSLTTGAL